MPWLLFKDAVTLAIIYEKYQSFSCNLTALRKIKQLSANAVESGLVWQGL